MSDDEIVKSTDCGYEMKLYLFAFGTLNNLAELGLLTGGKYELTATGKVEFERLKDSGFKPSAEELHDAIQYIILSSNAELKRQEVADVR